MMEKSPSADNQQPSIVELAWLAGFIDGEGCVTMALVSRNNKKTKKPMYSITIYNMSHSTIERICDILKRAGVGHYVYRKTIKNGYFYAVIVSGIRRVSKLLETISDYLFTKKTQAELLDSFIKYRMTRWDNQSGKHTEDDPFIEKVHIALKKMHHDEGSETMCVATRLIGELKI